MKSFLMLGQSNMAGRGNFGEVEEINNPLCKMLRNGRWQYMSEPVNPDRGFFSCFHSICSLLIFQKVCELLQIQNRFFVFMTNHTPYYIETATVFRGCSFIS